MKVSRAEAAICCEIMKRPMSGGHSNGRTQMPHISDDQTPKRCNGWLHGDEMNGDWLPLHFRRQRQYLKLGCSGQYPN